MQTPILGLRTCIYKVDDLEKGIEWYSKAFKQAPYFSEPYYVGFNIGGYELGLQPASYDTVKTDNVLTYWGVENVEEAMAYFISLGATEHEAAMDVGVIVGSVKDPWGNAIGFIFNPHFKLD